MKHHVEGKMVKQHIKFLAKHFLTCKMQNLKHLSD